MRIRIRDQGRKMDGDYLAVPAMATFLSRWQQAMESGFTQFGCNISSDQSLVEIGLEMFQRNFALVFRGIC